MRELLEKLKQLGVSVSMVGDQLDIQAPKGTMTPTLLQEIKQYKKDLIDLLRGQNDIRQQIPVAAKQTNYVLSSAQQRLWALSQVTGGNQAYNMPSVFELSGSLDIPMLEKAFTALIERHEILRTAFILDQKGEPRQNIIDVNQYRFQLQYEVLEDKEVDNLLSESLQKELAHEFDLSLGVLIHAKLLKTKDQSHILCLVMHHIISDGWSAQVMAKELFAFYEGFLSRQTITLPPLTIQYKDYATWQQKELKQEAMQEHQNYWSTQFQGEVPVLNLSGYQSRPILKTYQGNTIRHSLDQGLLDNFRFLCQSSQATLYMGLLTVTKILLQRYTGQQDIVIGSPVAGRDYSELHDQVGFYINTLAIRTQLDQDDNFSTSLEKVKQQVLDTQSHQEYPFDTLLEELDMNFDVSRNPLFDVMMTLQSFDHSTGSTKLQDLEVRPYHAPELRTSKLDLEFVFLPQADGLELQLTYNSDIYDEVFICRMAEHYFLLLEELIAQPKAPFHMLNYLSKSEYEQWAKPWNISQTPFPKNKTFIKLFEDQVQRNPDLIAVVVENREISYDELNGLANQLATYLSWEKSVEMQDFVGVRLERSEWLVITFLSLMKLGAVYVPIDTNYPASRTDYIKKDSGCNLIIEQNIIKDFQAHADNLTVDRFEPKVTLRDLAYVIYTSGSTGVPKGVMVEHGNLLNLCFWHNETYEVESDSRGTLFSGIAFDASIWEFCPYLLQGATLYPITEDVTRVDVTKLGAYCREYEITHAYFPTQICQEIVVQKVKMPSMKILTGGDVLKINDLGGLDIYNNYGPTENTVVATSYRLKEGLSASIPIGRPIANTQVYVLDQYQQPLPTGAVGNLFITGESVARGYLNQPELTQDRFLEDPFVKGRRMYNTGDLVKVLPDGNIAFVGRNDNQVKIRGYRIELGEIESQLLKCTGILQAVGEVQEYEDSKSIVAYLVSEGPLNKNKTQEQLKHFLPSYMVPKFFVSVDTIPLTVNGKVDKSKLPKPKREDMIMVTYEAPETDLEKALVAIWEEALGITNISTTAAIFDLGGNSLNIIKIINMIKARLGYEIAFEEVFQYPSIRELIPLLRKDTYRPIACIEAQNDYPLTSAQLRFWILCQMENINVAYNMPYTLKMQGQVDEEALYKAFLQLIKRHESLRTCFEENGNGEVRQKVIPVDMLKFQMPIKEVDEAALPTLISTFNNSSFDLSLAPLLRASLFKVSSDEVYLCFNLHHIVGDGQSLLILVEELAICYNVIVTARAVTLPKLKVQYKDYVNWATIQLENDAEKEEHFWLEELSGELPVINIPTYRPRPITQTFDGAYLTQNLEPILTKELINFAHQQEATVFMTCLAALNGLLSKYTNQTDIVLGTPVSGRSHKDLEQQIGLYINTVPIRTQFQSTDSFVDLLATQKRTLLRAYANSNYPFGELVNKLPLHRDPSRSPIFDVLVIHQQQSESKTDISSAFQGVQCEPQDLGENKASKFDMTFSFVEDQSNLSIGVEYNTNLYEASFIQDMMSNFQVFLKEAIRQPSKELVHTKCLTSMQEQRILKVFNNTSVDYDQSDTIVSLFQNQVKLIPEQTALICHRETLSYRALDEKSTLLALYLQSKGIRTGDTVGICMGRSLDMMVGILGVLKSGAAYLPLDPFYPLDRLDYIIDHSQTDYVLTDEGTRHMLTTKVRTIVLQDEAIWSSSMTSFTFVPERLSPAYVIYTSGSTGKPKGVQVSHQNLVNFIIGMNQTFGQSTDRDTWLAVTSISFDISILELLWTLTRGNKVVMHLDRPVQISPQPKIDFSLFYFPTGQGTSTNKYQLLLEGAKYADKHRFESIWVPERHFHEFGDQFPNPAIAAAAVSTCTEHIKLRSGSVVLPLHDPVRVAEEWSMIDNLSKGRVELSIASGWHPNDFVLAPDDYQNRHAIMREGIQTLQHLWKGNTITRKNGVGKDYEFRIHPNPIQQELPIWITAAGSVDTFKYAGEIGANILTHLLGQSIEDLIEKIGSYRQALKDNGHDPNKGKVALMLHTFVSDDSTYVKKVVEAPFKAYLKNSLNLLKPLAEEQGLNVEDDIDTLLDIAFLRFYNTSSLFGTPDSCMEVVNQLYQRGVNEIACLIDFGIEEELVLANLQNLNKLKERIRRTHHQYIYMVDYMEQLGKEETIPALIQHYQVSHLQATPSFYEELLLDKEGKQALKTIDTLLVGGETLKGALAKQLLQVIEGPIYNMYGPTETTIWSAVKKVGTADNITIGQPIANTQIYILNPELQLCPIGVSGELYIGGDGVTLGYLHNLLLTKERFVESPFVNGQRLYKTGDLARWLPHGELEFLGRMDRQVKIRGYRIELEEIENVALEIPEVSQCVVLTWNKNEQIGLTAYLKSEQHYTENDVKAFLRARLPAYMVPQSVVVLKEFPYTPNGKVDTKKLPVEEYEEAMTTVYVAPRNEMERKLAKLWAEFLQLDQVGIEDNFFEIGGNSMKVFQLLPVLNEALGLDLKIITFFQFPTVRMLTENLKAKEEAQKTVVEENEMENVDDLLDFMDTI
ncbi:amino acid adenylation domain-containing protein/natural product biosynthesis luciferase-like monooxygenase protein [Aquimarina sp. MAR_2010_214]|nr:amino acid adenylation domain-containing protein/natural product biosynthesis luciferase-like monooxygenase protein [Aquimarina sp. MAR_2010_214]